MQGKTNNHHNKTETIINGTYIMTAITNFNQTCLNIVSLSGRVTGM